MSKAPRPLGRRACRGIGYWLRTRGSRLAAATVLSITGPIFADQGFATETAWRRCAGGAELRLWMIEALDHRWWVPVNDDLWQALARHRLTNQRKSLGSPHSAEA